MKSTPLEIALATAGAGSVLWLLLSLMMQAQPFAAVVLLVISGAISIGGLAFLIRRKLTKRRALFIEQLELALRLIANGVRIGLALRQSLAIVTENMPDPARHEYLRVMGKTNIGVSVYDALDELATRMPGNETRMMAAAVRIQSQTGGDLGRILEHLADTIKERRRIQRKIAAMTSEGRSSAIILIALPPLLGVFLSVIERTLGAALLFTTPGHVVILAIVGLEGMGAFVLSRMLQIDT
jgi:tight adherence protein B